MSIRKNDFNEMVKNWVTKHLKEDLMLELVKVYKKKNLSKENDPLLQNIKNINLCDFICDFVFLVKDKDLKLILVNTTLKPIGIVDIGELVTYSRVSNPLNAYLISSKGFSSEISNSLSNPGLTEKLFKFGKNFIIGFQLDKNEINIDSVLPVIKRDFIR